MSAVLLAIQHKATPVWQENVHNQNKPRGGNEMNAMAMENKQIEGFKAPKMSFREAMKNEKGLTLIELLAVIVIIAIIAAIAIPSISSILERTKANAHKSNAHMMVDAARLYVTGEGITVPTNGNVTVNMADLQAKGYLQIIPQDPSNKGTTYTAGTKTTAPATPATDGSKVVITNTAGIFTYVVHLVNGTHNYLTVDGTDVGTPGVEEANLDTIAVVLP
ncbi:prepilin-type N-terminal cleavage/methylation domain-containing protein [Paenibacillus qinlingensis]|uniref:Type IV pilus assembly protein PilA n=1 Tax=Paenibacillus qinlingensis TaxID=1837343 RepID=A0ABU1NPZ8_9BACL|nr:prepilin-type N-terminal cleavage/methylation domain-containing protein [Paenibacillus qinlingensis]MDR6549539.1 type IV pilus assembly protein PilA [Paenibacillus qinlingensis]